MSGLDSFVSIVMNSGFLNNLILIGFFVVFLILFFKEHRDPKSPIRWTDAICDQKSGKLSLTKLGQLWGISISSWVVIYMAQMSAAYTIFPMVFAAYLAYLGGSTAFNKYIKNKSESDPK